jgi:3',5'-cyclic AMP phosphodiesterase CpdA
MPRGQSVLGLDPVARLEACIADINRNRGDARFCVFTGDLTDRGEREGYGVLRDCLAYLELPYYLMLGNHDRRAPFLANFPDAPRDEDGFVQFELSTPVGRLLFLDTLDEGRSAGLYCDRRCRWLSNRLTEVGSESVYLFMHHPPFDIGIPSLDRMKLDDADAFAEALAGPADIRSRAPTGVRMLARHPFLGTAEHQPPNCRRLRDGIPHALLPRDPRVCHRRS